MGISVMSKRTERIPFQTQGYGKDETLYFSPSLAQCGDIVDGVAFEHGKEGGWVLSYGDLIKMAEMAKNARTP